MTKSAFEDPKFAKFWDEVSGRYGQTYKRYVVDPCMFKLMGNLQRKTVVDLGCGNGYLGRQFFRKGAKRVIFLDISAANLENARRLNRNHLDRVEFLRQDALKPWKIATASVDVVFTDMMLNEVGNIRSPLRESFRVLRRGGVLVVAVTHPAWDLFEFACDLHGKPRDIVRGAGPYFFRGYSRFLMGTQSLRPKAGFEYPESFEIEHYQRPIEDYVSAIQKAGFTLKNFREPEMPERLLAKFPGYREMSTHPIGLIFLAVK